MSSPEQASSPQQNRVRIVVATSVMLTFISFWRAAAIVLNDLGSSAFYAGSIAEQAVGKAAPWFILGVMLFSFTVRSVYVESCSMFVRGGVYRVVKEAVGGTLAKISVSALMFDYVLTGPISGVSAGQYIAGLLNQLLLAADTHGWIPRALHQFFEGTPRVDVNTTAVVVALAVTLYYWWQNTKGIEESSEKAMRVMEITTVMAVLLLGWSLFTLLRGNYALPPWPVPQNLTFSRESLGFLKDAELHKMFGLFGIMIAFGHAVLAMSGEETLAQVYREIGSPKLKNLKKTALIIAVFSFLFTGVTSLLVVMLVPDSVRMLPENKDNLLGTLAMYLAGPQLLKLFFRAFVVIVGFLMLSGAINTSIVGANGVLNRVSEDGVLTDWFRKPHKRYGTSYRILNLVVGLQLFAILVSRGDVYVLGEAYAFGVIWSFTFNSFSMLVLRFKYKGERGWKLPPNITIRGVEIPIGLASVFLVLFSTAVVNLFTKSVATIAGVIFTGVLFVIFTVSEHMNRRKLLASGEQMKEHFQLQQEETVQREHLGIRPGNILVTVRDYNTLNHLKWVLERADTKEQDVVVMAARMVPETGAGEYALTTEQIFSDYEQLLFTRATAVAEGYGKHISLLVVPARDVWTAIVQTANSLESSAIVAGLSSKMPALEQSFRLGRAWEAMPEPKRQFVVQIVRPDMAAETFRIGPHTPDLKTEDIHLTHRMWLDLTKNPGLEKLHHSDIVSVALTRLARDLFGAERDEIMKRLGRGVMDKRFGRLSPPSPPQPPPAEPGAASESSPEKPAKKQEEKEPTEPPITGPE
jgi:amino acid transporter